MTKRNKKRYQARPDHSPRLTLTGNVYLKYEDEEAIASAGKGDLMLYLNTDNAPQPLIKGDYHTTGYAGYFKADIYDGRKWTPLHLTDFFAARQHHFHKKEQAHDCYLLCAEILRVQIGAEVIRTYREHYERVEE